MKLKEVVKWSNGMVMVFDENGDQVPDLQGRYDAVREKVLAAADSDTTFTHGVWSPASSEVVDRESW